MTGHESFNPDIISLLESHDIKEMDAALLYLLSIHFELSPNDTIPLEVIRRVNYTKIVVRSLEEGGAPLWVVPLFAPVEPSLEENWRWIADYRKLFSDVRPSAKADLGGVLKKMKQYFAENPHVRREDIMEAARNYIDEFKRSGQELKYLQQADHFIYKRASRYGDAQSRLTGYLETIYEERKRGAENGITGNRFMQEMR